jgi:hypothetical protein
MPMPTQRYALDISTARCPDEFIHAEIVCAGSGFHPGCSSSVSPIRPKALLAAIREACPK